MKETNMSEHNKGIFYAAVSYLSWGIIPLYWKLLDHVSALEILAHRIFWSFLFVLMIIVFVKKRSLLKKELSNLLHNRRTFLGIVACSLLVTTNWFVFIWAVNSDHIIQTSLGYYINPLISVLLAVIVLKERLVFWQSVSFILAGIGVLFLTIQVDSFPWVAISLALSFGLYGLVKKLTKLDSLIGLTLETMVITPIALFYLTSQYVRGVDSFSHSTFVEQLLLIGAGVATALPLLWFAQGTRRIPLSLIGILQYIAPTISLMIGVFLYNEEFTNVHAVTFFFIWTALVIYSFSKTKLMTRLEPRFMKKKPIETAN
jgi:chloramphenicol-sensitive protein RarD